MFSLPVRLSSIAGANPPEIGSLRGSHFQYHRLIFSASFVSYSPPPLSLPPNNHLAFMYLTKIRHRNGNHRKLQQTRRDQSRQNLPHEPIPLPEVHRPVQGHNWGRLSLQAGLDLRSPHGFRPQRHAADLGHGGTGALPKPRGGILPRG